MEEQETKVEQDVHNEPQVVAEPVVTPVSEKPAASTMRSLTPKHTAIIAGVIFILAACAAAYVWYQGGMHGVAGINSATNYPAIVATVNGENITASDLQKSVKQTENVAAQQGADLNDPNVKSEIQAQALSLLVNSKLLFQAATKAGISASSSEIDAQYAAIVSQFGGADKLDAQMKSDGITEADLRQNIQEQMVIKQYLEMNPSYANATVTDAEVSTAYDNFKTQSNSTSTPPLSQIADEIKQQLLQQKQQNAINAIVDQLHASSTVKTNI